MTYRVEIGPPGNVKKELKSDTLTDVNVAREATALSDADITAVYDPDLRNYALEPFRIYATDSGTVVFRGYLQKLDWDQRRGTTKIITEGIGDDLKGDPIEVSASKKAVWEIIRDVWKNHTSFDYMVHQPNPTKRKDDAIIADLSATSDFDSNISPAATDPIITTSDRIELAQTCFFTQAEDATYTGTKQQSTGDVSSDNYNDKGEAIILGADTSHEVQVSFTTDHDIPAADIQLAVRLGNTSGISDGHGLDFKIDGNDIGGVANGFSISGNWTWLTGTGLSNDLAAGSHTATVTVSGTSTDDVWIDVVAPRDARYSYNDDNSVNSNYALDGPELYPDGEDVVIGQFSSDLNVVQVKVSSSWKDSETSGAQQISTSVDGGSTWDTASNTTSITSDYPNNKGTTIDTRATLDRYGSRSTGVSPTTGFKSQGVDTWTVKYDGTDLAVVDDQTFRGDPFSVLKKLHDNYGFTFSIDHANTDNNGNLKKYVESFKDGSQSKSANWTVLNRRPSVDFREYANKVTIYGALQSDGTRPKATVQDDSEVSTYGTVGFVDKAPSADNLDDTRSIARSVLNTKVAKRKRKGKLQIAPINILPGYDYSVDWFGDGTTTDVPVKRVEWGEQLDRASGTLQFSEDDDIVASVVDVGFVAADAIDNL